MPEEARKGFEQEVAQMAKRKCGWKMAPDFRNQKEVTPVR
jgi:hypothetical protein